MDYLDGFKRGKNEKKLHFTGRRIEVWSICPRLWSVLQPTVSLRLAEASLQPFLTSLFQVGYRCATFALLPAERAAGNHWKGCGCVTSGQGTRISTLIFRLPNL
jgi:hypothetical protein